MSDFFESEDEGIKTYPTLYARTSTGATQIWYMEKDGNKYRSISGQKNGLKVVAEWTLASSKNTGKKNATTPVKQAEDEIQSKYDKQLKSGGYWENENDIDKERFFQVMLAKSYEDYKDKIDWSKGVAIQIKYNGGRIVAKKEGTYTRKGEKYISITHIEECLKPFFNKFPDAVLDGEGFNFDYREKLNELMKLLRKTVHISSDDLKRSKELIRFNIYDGFNFSAAKDGKIVTKDCCYLERKAAIDNAFFAPCFKDRYKDVIGYVPTMIVYSEKELEKLYEEFLKEKHEGAILRILGEGYQEKRSKFLLKYKPINDAEFKIISVQDGDGKFANRIATVTCQRIDGKKYLDGTDTFDATFKGEEDDAFECWKNGSYKDLIGKNLTIHYNGLTGFEKPNYARLDWNNYLNDK